MVEWNSTTFAIAFLAGVIPALFWLWFWLREDKVRPEPRSLIVTAFLAGMLVVAAVLPLQQYAMERFKGNDLIFVWVIIEEILKYTAALVVVFWHKAVDEPIDTIIYMITIALGFSALENTLFIYNPLSSGDVVNSILTGHFRFLGATLLHVLASGTVGVFMAFAYYKSNTYRVVSATLGLCLAILLHALFNFFIMDASGNTVLGVFMFVWMGIIVLFLTFEKVKIIERVHRTVL
jgi:RsiW-degrading membrane proteinase PrsW (M82 family)